MGTSESATSCRRRRPRGTPPGCTRRCDSRRPPVVQTCDGEKFATCKSRWVSRLDGGEYSTIRSRSLRLARRAGPVHEMTSLSEYPDHPVLHEECDPGFGRIYRIWTTGLRSGALRTERSVGKLRGARHCWLHRFNRLYLLKTTISNPNASARHAQKIAILRTTHAGTV